jgi:hypothetical protein
MKLPLVALVLASTFLLPGPALAASEDQLLERMLRGESAMQGQELERAVTAAEAHPLGSKENPVRVAMPPGQRAYLARLRCSDGRTPRFHRRGNAGVGVFGNIVDIYDVRCIDAEPATRAIYMDMYHRGREEELAVPGYTLVTAKGPPVPPPPAPPPPSAPVQVRVPEPTG